MQKMGFSFVPLQPSRPLFSLEKLIRTEHFSFTLTVGSLFSGLGEFHALYRPSLLEMKKHHLRLKTYFIAMSHFQPAAERILSSVR